MTTKETLGRRVLALERRRLRPRNVSEMSDDELVSIVMGYPCRAADITDEELRDCVLTDEELQEIIEARRS